MKNPFTNEDAWQGEFYELAIEIGDRNDVLLERSLATCWAHESLEGCYADRSAAPSRQTRLVPSLLLLQGNCGHLYGLATLPDGNRVPCGTCSVREDDGPDWFVLYVPFEALARTYRQLHNYPPLNDERALGLYLQLDRWFAGIGKHVYSAVPYRLGLVGVEVSGLAYAEDVRRRGIQWPSVCHLVPSETGLVIHEAKI